MVATVDASVLRANFRAIRRLVPNHGILPMLKADGYGHGAIWAARELLDLPGLEGFGMATLEEGARLRQTLGRRGLRARVVIFSGTAPWTEEKGRFCERNGLSPVISTYEDWLQFLKQGWPRRLSYELKFNTGMNRLGIDPARAAEIARQLRDRPATWHPGGIFSHLAMAEEPGSRLSRGQLDRFEGLRSDLSPAFPAARFHLANSAGIWNRAAWRLDHLTQLVRPGLSLYGVVPYEGAPAHGLRPVLTLRAKVAAIHRLGAGERLGYGGTFVVPRRSKGVRVATLLAGYADGVHRTLSNRGQVWLGGRLERVLGRVSMDLCAVSCGDRVRVGDWAELIGPHIDLWKQAEAAGTVPYELLTSISGRAERVEREEKE